MAKSAEQEFVAQPSVPLGVAERIDQDIYRRCLPMIPAFVFLWLGILGLTGFYRAERELSLWLLAIFGGVAVFQLLLAACQAKLYKFSLAAWRLCFFGSIFVNAVVWSALFTACFFEPILSPLQLPVTLATAGLANLGLSNFAPSRWVAQSYTSVLILPAVLVCFSSQAHLAAGAMVVVYWFYSLLILQRFHAEYCSRFDNENDFVQQHSDLQRQNRTDGLTKVFNRRYFDEAIDREWVRGAEEGTWLALLFIDIDFFKKINDTYGHLVGDECLMQAAAIINGAVQPGNDTVARYGGEEFAVLLPNTSPEMAKRIAESIRRQFDLKTFTSGKHALRVTASIGVSAMVPRRTQTPKILIDQADQGVYLAKESGRNNVQLFGAAH